MAIHRLFVIPALAALLAGCSNAVPKCSDPQTVDTVIRLITQQLDQDVAMQPLKWHLNAQGQKMHSRLDGITTVAVDKATGAQFCEALLVHVLTKEGREEGATDGRIISYESYLSDDGSPYVTVSGDF